MPELPEVETVRRGIAPVMEGELIANVQVNRPDLRWPFPDRMAERLKGRHVTQVRRRSKYILVDVDSGETLLIHLGMSGRILISGDPQGRFVHDHPAVQKHDHVVFEMRSGARITYNDPRRFGAMDLLDRAGADEHPLLRDIGPEPFGNGFAPDPFFSAIKGRNSPIKSVLLDQKTVAGLGNIYVCETLFRAGIDPQTKANKLSRKRADSLVPIIRDVLSEAIEAGGSSLKDFRQADGELGYFQHSFDVYGRENEPCRTVDCKGTIRRIVQSGRSTFLCAQCQR
ncbi:MAG: bifunctional DNA-formamidopyrimidine glycosylase/DNA-(apurinic or apyrimidinic site) lyase [Paracoccaceae bacterium]|jgi:formamidopyrimidine-DNA glycosylase|nr:bifunctional DNA-formamidopyrimidine glycosylase/DNA-(apurinic or apyrimidinic site) lyase [Paracoccaceae bacterium]